LGGGGEKRNKRLVELFGARPLAGWLKPRGTAHLPVRQHLRRRCNHGEIYANPQATQHIDDMFFLMLKAWLMAEGCTASSTKRGNLGRAVSCLEMAPIKPKGILANHFGATDGLYSMHFGTIQKINSVETAGDFGADERFLWSTSLKRAYRGKTAHVMLGGTYPVSSPDYEGSGKGNYYLAAQALQGRSSLASFARTFPWS